MIICKEVNAWEKFQSLEILLKLFTQIMGDDYSFCIMKDNYKGMKSLGGEGWVN